MHIKSVLCISAALAGAASALNLPKFSQHDIDSGSALAALNKIATQNAMKAFKGKCQESDYKALFLPWHRYLLHTYEQQLAACGYKGPIPYWEWGFDTEEDLSKSPMFDGSDASLGADGDRVPHEGYNMSYDPLARSVPGCPFGGLETHLGPVLLTDWGTSTYTSVENPRLKNTRCLKRDLNSVLLHKHANFRNTTNLILRSNELDIFQAALVRAASLEAVTHSYDPRFAPFVGDQGVHFGGHVSIGGDPAGDVFLSSGDPAFYLHHGQIDRVWWIWQNLDPANRLYNVSGTPTFLNSPPTADVTVDESIVVHPDFPPVVIKDFMNTLTGDPLCYVYI
ncbi:hypothetical protein QBC32DRAFT_389685 [Pseudoneurospora amorphoporcata]|uniref:Tyrosinase copper-binding domain-containing protein n=1 Tax=Pseudoneurospora amorphoporcata TaxID=241081 RepID=A0AAN6SJA1_9PEZI|nr:hypothetical protein QBC32DRAFT_389685 [Pseudoneurospora amorphoporcata]